MTTDTPVSQLTDDALRELVESAEDAQDKLMLLSAGNADEEAIREALWQLNRARDAEIEWICRNGGV